MLSNNSTRKLLMSKKKVILPVKAKPGPTVAERILDIVAGGYDAQKIAHALAKKHPTLFLELYQQVAAPVSTWHKDVVQHLYAYLQHSMCSRLRPAHLLLLHKSLTDELVHGRLHKRG